MKKIKKVKKLVKKKQTQKSDDEQELTYTIEQKDDTKTIHFFQQNEYLIQGNFYLKVIKGNVQILGADLIKDQFFNINSKSPYSLLTLKISQNLKENESIAIVEIKQFDQFKIEEINDNCVHWNLEHLKIVNGLKSEIFYCEKLKILLAGQKNSGKSLFSIFLMNNLLGSIQDDQSIYYLETDLGQPSFSVPSIVALYKFKKNEFQLFNQQTKCYKSEIQFFIGEFSPQQYINQYLDAIQKCIQYFNDFTNNSILIINTHGFITNIGEILFYDMCKIIDPQYILFLFEQQKKECIQNIEKNLHNKNYQKRMSFIRQIIPLEKNKKQLIQIPQNEKQINKSQINHQKKQYKDISFIQYFAQNQEQFTNFRNYNKLSLFKSYKCQINQIKFMLLRTYDNLNYQLINDVKSIAQIFINSIVALYENMQNGCEMFQGFGFIKDFDQTNFYIVSPLEQLENINYIMKSREVDFSNEFYLDHVNESFNLSQCMGDELTGSEFTETFNGGLLGAYQQKVVRKPN